MYDNSMKQWTPEEIKEFRKSLNLYQKDFALMLGVTTRYIIYIEQGVKKPGKTFRLFLDCLKREEEGKRKRKGGQKMATGTYKRSNVWWIRYTGIDGRQKRESSHSKEYKAAIALLADRQKTITNGK